ncbi:MAG: DMT family transporter [Gammaproteobacteria bacterium]|nr:DMT family transporter [Gammaproteobacteria bacterium]
MLSRIDPRLLVVFGAVLFSTGGAAIKATTLTGWQVAAFRSGIAGLALLIMLPAVRRQVTWRVLLVAMAYATTLTLYVLANKLTTAANTIFLQSTAPLYLLFLGPLFLREHTHKRDLWFMLALALGLALFFVAIDTPTQTAPAPLAGNLLGGLAGFSWALTLLGLRWLALDKGPGTPAAAAATGNLLTFVVCVYWALPVISPTPQDWLLVAYLGVFQIGVAYVLVTAAMPRVTALEASLLILIEPVLNPVWAWLFLGETPGKLALVAAGIITISIVLRTLQQSRLKETVQKS